MRKFFLIIAVLVAVGGIGGWIALERTSPAKRACGATFTCPLTGEPICPCCCPLNRGS